MLPPVLGVPPITSPAVVIPILFAISGFPGIVGVLPICATPGNVDNLCVSGIAANACVAADPGNIPIPVEPRLYPVYAPNAPRARAPNPPTPCCLAP